jgi:hypothetical protein
MSRSTGDSGPSGEEEEDVGPLPFEDEAEDENEADEEAIPTLAPDHRLFKRLQEDLKR